MLVKWFWGLACMYLFFYSYIYFSVNQIFFAFLIFLILENKLLFDGNANSGPSKQIMTIRAFNHTAKTEIMQSQKSKN